MPVVPSNDKSPDSWIQPRPAGVEFLPPLSLLPLLSPLLLSLLPPLSLLLLSLLLLPLVLQPRLLLLFAVAACSHLACVTCPPAHTPAGLRVRKPLLCVLWLEHQKGTALRGLVLAAMFAPPTCRQAGVHLLSLYRIVGNFVLCCFHVIRCVMSKHALMRGSCC